MTAEQLREASDRVCRALREDKQLRHRVPDLAPRSVLLTIAQVFPGIPVHVDLVGRRQGGAVESVTHLGHTGKVGE